MITLAFAGKERPLLRIMIDLRPHRYGLPPSLSRLSAGRQ